MFVCDKDFMWPDIIINYGPLVQEDMQQFRKIVNLKWWEPTGIKKKYQDEPSKASIVSIKIPVNKTADQVDFKNPPKWERQWFWRRFIYQIIWNLSRVWQRWSYKKGLQIQCNWFWWGFIREVYSKSSKTISPRILLLIMHNIWQQPPWTATIISIHSVLFE